MKKIIVLVCGLCLALPSFATLPFWVHFGAQNHNLSGQKSKKIIHSNSLNYANFTGNWEGNCQSSSNESYSSHFTVNNDAETINLSGLIIDIDAISSQSSTSKKRNENDTYHMRWNGDRQQLLGTFLGFSKEGKMSTGGMEVHTGTMSFSLENDELVFAATISAYLDGDLILDKESTVCRYSRVTETL